MLISTISLTFYFYLENPTKKESKDLEKTYAHFLNKKDKEISDLKEKSQILFNASVKRSQENLDLGNLKNNLDKTKLVRDKIPQIIIKNGDNAKTHVANESEFNSRLKDKLQEEVNEYLESNNSEELADILEVLYSLEDRVKLEQLRSKKELERGSFNDRIILD